MIKNLYAVVDSKTSFMEPFTDVNDESAIRGFCFSVNNNPGIVGFAPSDFNLYCLGTFDTDSGVIVPVSPLRFVFSGVNAFQSRGGENA